MTQKINCLTSILFSLFYSNLLACTRYIPVYFKLVSIRCIMIIWKPDVLSISSQHDQHLSVMKLMFWKYPTLKRLALNFNG